MMKRYLKLSAALLGVFMLSACGQTLKEGSSSVRTGVDSYMVPGVSDTVFFAFDSSAINSDAREVLGQQADHLKSHPDQGVIVEGHCDERGTREYNLALGERRANAVKQYLMSLGVQGKRIDTISYGKERPGVPGSNEEAWARNRRAKTLINDFSESK